MRLAWSTDPHLEWLKSKLNEFIDSLANSGAYAIIISGDLSSAEQIKYHLRKFSELPIPVYFVLGNHDIYGSSFEYVHTTVRKSVRNSKNLVWLSEADPLSLLNIHIL